ncbi:ribulose bisphosphate carboxylase small chain [Carex littledalei]|uniref:Ribulose bisphosphate carboxylase small subunit, chloroplastic n=1 Tax=Carex littledalei TaxID=544730 RepID=A0A833R3A6_9POAL|nr:ribulose bisphosphate carboxylase small chain [Carex littledalei]
MESMIGSSAITMARAAAPSKGVSSFLGRQADKVAVGGRRATGRSNRMKVNCMQVWPIEGKKKFETLSYLPDLSQEELLKQIEYLIRSNWIPCLEFSKVGFISRDNHSSPGYYDGRYWTMWKLPMFGCTDATQVAKEVEECRKEYPDAFIRILGFDNSRQVQCISFIAFKPPGDY